VADRSSAANTVLPVIDPSENSNLEISSKSIDATTREDTATAALQGMYLFNTPAYASLKTYILFFTNFTPYILFFANF
jgi:hypothetical protein